MNKKKVYGLRWSYKERSPKASAKKTQENKIIFFKLAFYWWCSHWIFYNCIDDVILGDSICYIGHVVIEFFLINTVLVVSSWTLMCL